MVVVIRIPDVGNGTRTKLSRKRSPKPWRQTSIQGIDTTNPVNEKLLQARARIEQGEGTTCYIYKVPWCLQCRGSNDALRPRLVSLGPYHYGDPQLEGMQFHKYRVLDCVLRRKGLNDISPLIDVVIDLEHEARAAYQDFPTTSFPSDVFLEMLVLDGCFVIDFLVGRYEQSHTDLGYDKEDHIFSHLYMYYGIQGDMMLLENQIPLPILQRLYEYQFGLHQQKVIKLMLAAFSSSWVIGRPVLTSEAREKFLLSSLATRNNMLSCLEIFWENLMYGDIMVESQLKVISLPVINKRCMLDLQQHIIPSVTALKDAGVRFKHTNTLPFWDIKFKKGVLEIPQIMIYEASESIFLNLMAFELQRIYTEDCKITAYILFMDSLVNSASDVAVLRAHGIIACAGQSDEEVADLFNCLGRQVFIPFNQFEELSEQISKFCNKRRNRWRAALMHNYFNNPWAIISVIAAALLLLLTIIQTSYTMFQYYQKP